MNSGRSNKDDDTISAPAQKRRKKHGKHQRKEANQRHNDRHRNGILPDAGSSVRMHLFVKHNVENEEHLIIENDEALKLSRAAGIMSPVANATLRHTCCFDES